MRLLGTSPHRRAALAVDASARVHLVWSQGGEADGPATSLFYTGLEGQLLTQAVQIVAAPGGEMARQPDLLVDGEDRLHLVYSGGEFGEIFYTSADAALAASAGGWLPPTILSYAPGPPGRRSPWRRMARCISFT
jgi:hypothetical protein